VPTQDPPITTRRFRAFLFDMDGTIINSTAAAERVWGAWALRHGLDLATFLPKMHGSRAEDTIARLGLPGVDAQAEALGITQAEVDDVEGIVQIPGAAHFLSSLPPDKWAIVTSAPVALATRRLQQAGIPLPRCMVTAEEVSAGKPNPEGYLLAAKKLGVDPADCLVFEDAAVGIRAGEAAGAAVMVITASHKQPMETLHASVASYDELVVGIDEGGYLVLEKR
jgi:sugar-phosphatase